MKSHYQTIKLFIMRYIDQNICTKSIIMLSIYNIDTQDMKEYYIILQDLLTRYDIQYLMDQGIYDSYIKSNVHYIFLSYIRDMTDRKISDMTDISCISEYSIDEVIRLFDGPLSKRNWPHIRCLYNAGFRDEVFCHYTGYIIPSNLGYENDPEIYEYMIRLHNIPYSEQYERYFDIWYMIDPKSVEGFKVSCTMENIRMLKRLGIKNAIQYITRPSGDQYVFDIKLANYYIAGYELAGICPYDQIDQEDTPYTISLESHVFASYVRYFKKYGIVTNKRYCLDIGDIEGHSLIPDVLDIIDNISYEYILEYYIFTGKYKDYIPSCVNIDPNYSFDINHIDHNRLQRLVDVGFIKNVILTYNSILTVDVAKILHDNGIRLKLYKCNILTVCIAIEYDLITLDYDDILWLRTHPYSISNCKLYKIIMYPRAIITIWNKWPSLCLLHIISKYAPNIIHKITIPNELSKYCSSNDITRNFSYKSDIQFIFYDH